MSGGIDGVRRKPTQSRRVRYVVFRVIPIVYLSVAVYSAVTDNHVGLPADATAEERAAFRALEKHCARCHEGGYSGGFANAPRFGILDLRGLAGNRSFVTPGNPMASKIRSLIDRDADPPMPLDCYEGGWCSVPTEDEIAKLDAWILSLAAARAESRTTAAPSGVPYDLPADATPVETAAYQVLSTHCARCHQEGRLKPGLSKGKSGLGYILELRTLAEVPGLVQPGKPEESRLFNVIGRDGAPPPMPDDGASAGYPTAKESEHIAAWIRSLASPDVPRPFVSLADQHELAGADLHRQPTHRWSRIRYLSLRVPHNDTEVSAARLHAFRTATLKLLNALSWNPNPLRYEEVDEHGILIRVFLPDLGWDENTWGLLEREYRHGATSDVDGALMQLRTNTGAAVPVIRADWFAAHASVSPLYYEVLELPDTFDALTQLLGVDLHRNIRDEQVIRAGFQDSGVSTNNRLIERHAMGSGFFWTSYDFAGSAGRQNLFDYPLGPPGVYADDSRAFQHDGGESIFTLPNGFHAYYLNAADGARLDAGPTEIVRDDDYTEGTGAVVNAISCMSCHARGIRFNEDKVRPGALSNLLFSARERQSIAALYPEPEELQAVLRRDKADFAAALEAAGLDADVEAGGREPIRGLFMYYVDDFIGFARAASELGLTGEQLHDRVGFGGMDMQGLLRRLDQSPIARDEWTAVFPMLLDRLTNYEPITVGCPDPARTTAALPFSVRRLSGCPQPDLDVGASNRAGAPRQLTMFTDRPSYTVGDEVKIFVEPRATCRLTLINVDGDGDRCVLFPHPALADEPLRAGGRFVFPPHPFRMIVEEAGTETVFAVCNSAREAIIGGGVDTAAVSCDARQRSLSADEAARVVYRMLRLEATTSERTTEAGVTYKAFSSHNPDVVQAQISFDVSGK